MRMSVVALVAIAVALLGSGGGGAARTTPQLALSSPAAVDAYLRSIGVDPAHVVKQEGRLNYAGPSCPGRNWNCTTSRRVVQIASAGGSNTFECSGQSCVIVQTAPAEGDNDATCSQQAASSVAVQQCTITQDNVGGGNHASVQQESAASSGAEDARQSASVTQRSDGGDNSAAVSQSVRQSLTTGTVQQQNAHQVARVDQSVTGSSNFSDVHQTQGQFESGAATQFQNTALAPLGFDCGAEKVVNPNQCASVRQSGLSAPAGAANESHLSQSIVERQTTRAASSTQQQGRRDGGQEGNVHQENPVDLGTNLDDAHQDLFQRAENPSGTSSLHRQSQLSDPGCCGVGSQVGGSDSDESIDQTTTQSATEPLAAQNSTFVGQVHQVPPSTSPNNTCEIDQGASNNTGGGDFSASGSGGECTSLVLVTRCENRRVNPTAPACTSSQETPSVTTSSAHRSH
jgi:hypothetical protein